MLLNPPNRIALLIAWTSLLTSAVSSQAQDKSDPTEDKEDSSAAVAALEPLFRQISEAKSTRAKVELSADTVIDGAVISSQKSVYQIAATAPDKFTIYLKDEKQRTRIFCDGKDATIALSESAYTVLDKPIPMQRAVFELPVPMGPYPEPVLALTLAGIDPALTLTTGMKSVRLVDRNLFRGKTPSVHFQGIQEDDVKWELWITQDAIPKPLRLRVDLTEMLRANGGIELAKGYQYALRFDFPEWRINHENDESLYRYQALKGAKKFESVEAYFNREQR